MIGVCGGEEKCSLVKTYGAAATIDYNREDLKDQVKQITKSRSVDIVLDMVGGKTFEDLIRW